MEYKEWLIALLTNSDFFPAKAQRRKEKPECWSSFAPLRLCGRKTFILSLMLALLSLPCFSQSRMRAADVVKVMGVADAQISPNGQWVVYTVSSVDEDKNVSTVWIARIGFDAFPVPTPTPPRRPTTNVDWPEVRSAPRPLLPAGWNASSPRWSPDNNSIAFLSTHDEQDGLWVVKLDKPEPRLIAPITSTNFFITYAGETFSWSPDSRRIAYISAKAEAPEPASSQSRRTDDPRVIDRVQYKSRTSFSDNLRTHVWVVDVDRSPVPQQLTSGLFYDHAVAFSPRGDEVLFLSNREPDPDANNNSDIFAVDLNGQTRQLTQTRGCEFDPVWSPDGKSIAYTATARDITTIDSVAEDAHLWVIPASGGAGKDLTTEQDRRVRDPRWSPDGRSILYLAGDRGYTTIFKVGSDGGKVSRFSLFVMDGQLAAGFDPQESKQGFQITQIPSQITSFSFGNRAVTVGRGSAAETAYPFVITMGNAIRPNELWSGAGSLMPMRRLSAHNDSLLRSMRLVAPEEITFPSFDGTQIQGWLMRPPGCSSDRKCPLILSIHGGPHGMYGWSFNANFQVYAAQGYGVLFLNPRGSSGYGQKFSDGTINEWGGGDYRDLMAGVDEALKKNSWIDPSRLGVTGGSYGGFMTNWIITQTPRFKGAVAVASLSNLISFYSTSLYQDLIHAEFGGFPWDNFELLWQWSPLRYVRQVQTPTLFIHGENDNDVHITQAEEMYMALKRRGVETVLVRYPREGHGLREPKHRIDALERTLNWFDRYVK
jgi:dipeptidyl aminopeptidase/acylaminoacyl peptidase